MSYRPLATKVSWNEDNLRSWAIRNGYQSTLSRYLHRLEWLTQHNHLHLDLLDLLSSNPRLLLLVLRSRGCDRHCELGCEYRAVDLRPNHVYLLKPHLGKPRPIGDLLHLLRLLLCRWHPFPLLHEGDHGPDEGAAAEFVQ